MTKRKSYNKEFKLEAVQLVQSGKRVAEVARKLDLAEQTLHNWVKKFGTDGEATFVGSEFAQIKEAIYLIVKIKLIKS